MFTPPWGLQMTRHEIAVLVLYRVCGLASSERLLVGSSGTRLLSAEPCPKPCGWSVASSGQSHLRRAWLHLQAVTEKHNYRLQYYLHFELRLFWVSCYKILINLRFEIPTEYTFHVSHLPLNTHYQVFVRASYPLSTTDVHLKISNAVFTETFGKPSAIDAAYSRRPKLYVNPLNSKSV